MEDEDAKRLEVRLVDLSFRFKAVENIISAVVSFIRLVQKYINILLAIFVVILFVVYTNYSNATLLKEVSEMHNVTVAKIRYSIRKIGK